MAGFAFSRQPRVGIGLSHLTFDQDARFATPDQLIKGLTLHRGHDGKPHLLIFAEEINGSLEEASKRIMEHNKTAGVRRSVDGLFVLNQGFAMHIDQNQMGWTTHRLQGTAFGCLTVSRGQVLIKLQSIILKNLYLSGKTHPDGFDSYIAETGQGQREIASAKTLSDKEYIDQPDSESVVVRG